VRFNTTRPSRPKHCSRNGDVLILEHTANAVIGTSLNIIIGISETHRFQLG
jgi:hypothetical protein